MLRKLKLEGVGPSPSLELELAERLNVLTGDNGLGKSFLLEIAWWALTQTWAGPSALPRSDADHPAIAYVVHGTSGNAEPVASMFDREAQGWLLAPKRPPMPGIVIYAQIDGSFSLGDPARNSWRAAPSMKLDSPDRPPAYHFDDRSLWHGLTIADQRVCEGLIRDWVGWQKAREPEFEHLKKVLEVLSLPDEPIVPGTPMRVYLGEGYDTPTVQTRYGTVPLTHASAGVRRVAGLAYLLVWAWREHRLASQILKRAPERRLVLLVDEPETHLHPKWQRVIVPALLGAISALLESNEVEAQVITATHSPLVLASLEPIFDEARDALFDLDLVTDGGGAYVAVRHVPWRRRGDVSAWLTSEVFDLESARSAKAEEVRDEAAHEMATP